MFRPAGKTFFKKNSAKDCLEPKDPVRPVPDSIKKFTNTDAGRPGVGEIRRHWGAVEDDRIEANMIHGLKSKNSISASELLNPPMRTLFQDVKLADSESIYKSNKNAPLAQSAQPLAPVDEKFKLVGFGMKTEKCDSAGMTVNPQKNSETVDKEDRAGHELYWGLRLGNFRIFGLFRLFEIR